MSEKQPVKLEEEFIKAGKVINALHELMPESESVLGDEEGLIMGAEEDKISKIGICWDLSINLLTEMVSQGINFIITHTYPFLRVKAARLPGYTGLTEEALFTNNQKKKILRQEGITLYRAHLSWDNAKGGNNDVIAEKLGMERINKIPFGRTGYVKSIKLKDLAIKIKKELGTDYIKYVGNPESKVTSIMVTTGTGLLFTELIDYCYTQGIDVLVSGDLIKESAKRASELGISLIDAGAMETEMLGMKELTLQLINKGFKAEFYEEKPLHRYI